MQVNFQGKLFYMLLHIFSIVAKGIIKKIIVCTFDIFAKLSSTFKIRQRSVTLQLLQKYVRLIIIRIGFIFFYFFFSKITITPSILNYGHFPP